MNPYIDDLDTLEVGCKLAHPCADRLIITLFQRLQHSFGICMSVFEVSGYQFFEIGVHVNADLFIPLCVGLVWSYRSSCRRAISTWSLA